MKREKVPVTFQIWDISKLKRIHDAASVRDDLVVDFTGLISGGLPVLPASVGSGDYDAYLAVLPGETLADIYIQHGSRLLEGNVRTFLGRSSNVNKGIAQTVAKAPETFFAYNNGVAATPSAVTTSIVQVPILKAAQILGQVDGMEPCVVHDGEVGLFAKPACLFSQTTVAPGIAGVRPSVPGYVLRRDLSAKGATFQFVIMTPGRLSTHDTPLVRVPIRA
jgi:hypothetical protein